jgi:glyoxalase family protein
MSPRAVTGIHHVTAIAGDPQRNLDFYTEVLGLRLVKLTVNFDDPATYHFYFGNHDGTPGSILTFFPWLGAARGTVGVGQVSAAAFAVAPGSLDWWLARLGEESVPAEEAGLRFGERVLRLADPDGMPLELVGTARAAPGLAWRGAPVPPEHAIGGFHSATLAEVGYEKTAALLRSMGLVLTGSDDNRFRYAAPADGIGSVVDVLCTPDGRFGALGAGTIHHIAWRTPGDEAQRAWREGLVDTGYDVSPVMDRRYFHSIYFREPGGILFEIATDPPGFATDEAPDHLGERLMLPPWLEARRGAIERAVPRLTLPGPIAPGAAVR